MINGAAMNIELYGIESQILKLLSESEGNILDNTTLIETLAEAKVNKNHPQVLSLRVGGVLGSFRVGEVQQYTFLWCFRNRRIYEGRRRLVTPTHNKFAMNSEQLNHQVNQATRQNKWIGTFVTAHGKRDISFDSNLHSK